LPISIQFGFSRLINSIFSARNPFFELDFSRDGVAKAATMFVENQFGAVVCTRKCGTGAFAGRRVLRDNELIAPM